MKKKIGMIVLVLLILILISALTNYIDTGRVTTNHEPQCCIKIVNQDGSKVTYWGLGYKVVRYVGVSPEEPYESNIGVKMENWFMNYELPAEENEHEIENLDDFYQTKLTQNQDIRQLGKQYSLFDAQKDGCFVVGTTFQNEDVYQKFIENCNNQKSAFIRIAQNTMEGDLILRDVFYDAKFQLFFVVTDNTRDEFAAQEDRNIELKSFEHMGNLERQDQIDWVLYNGEMKEETIFILTTFHEKQLKK